MSTKDPGSQILRDHHWSLILCVFGIATASKVLLFPAYRSTDFDVHNHWKALTRHLEISEWYFDDESIQTVHTLDYPPGFALFEYAWSNNWATSWLLENGWLDKSCLDLKETTPQKLHQDYSVACVAYMRTTVILSELVYWLACYLWAWLVGGKKFDWNVFLLLALNPAILWLDHIHFQYNGFLLGILMLSIACLWQGAALKLQDGWEFHACHLGAATLYAFLLTLKHLYLSLALWYFFYLLRKYCFLTETNNRSKDSHIKPQFSIQRLAILGAVTLSSMLLPFLPFLSAHQLQQMLKRLFPFGRGLVHDYWAGNVWALYMALQKVVRKLPDDLPPSLVALLLLVFLLPGTWSAWNAARFPSHEKAQPQKAQSNVLAGLSYSALASFMFAYHVHEKAIVTTLLPLTVWALTAPASKKLYTFNALLLFRTQAFGLAGLLPLFFTPTLELPLKLAIFGLYLLFLYNVLEPLKSMQSEFRWKRGNILSGILGSQGEVIWVLLVVSSVVVVLELVPVSAFQRFEFLPLAYTSIMVACGLILSFFELLCVSIWDQEA